MPLYEFQEVKSGKIKSIFFNSKDAPSIGKVIIENGFEFRRIASMPQTASDTARIDPHSEKDFVRATSKGGTIGDLWKRSEEMSQKRGGNSGVDPIKEASFEAHEKRTGLIPFEKKKRIAKEKLAKKGIILE